MCYRQYHVYGSLWITNNVERQNNFQKNKLDQLNTGISTSLPCIIKAASHDSQMLVTATYSQQMTEVISSTSSFDQVRRWCMLHFCRRKLSAQVSQDTVS